MKDKLIDLIEISSNSLTLEQIVLHLVVASLLGVAVYISYYFSHEGTIYSKKFNISLVMMTILTTMVMTVIGNNIALSLGMVGALSIVRFRTAIKDSRDTAYIFWTVIIGICCGVGDYIVASIGTAAVFIFLLLFGRIRNDNRVLLIIKSSFSNERKIEGIVFDYFSQKANLRVKNTTDKTIEFIYELPKKYYTKALTKEKSITEALYELKNVEYVNIVSQNDEISG